MAAYKKQANFEKVSKALRANLLRRKAMQKNEKNAEGGDARRASNIEGGAPPKGRNNDTNNH